MLHSAERPPKQAGTTASPLKTPIVSPRENGRMREPNMKLGW